jgi:hypothetical protein
MLGFFKSQGQLRRPRSYEQEHARTVTDRSP